MHTDLDHLPANKRHDLELALRLLFEEFEDATRLSTSKHRKLGRILKVVLFGSYARGDWVDDADSGYKSDYDLLVVVNHDELTDVTEYWSKADDRLMREVLVTGRLSAPVNFIVHTIQDVNSQLKRGRYFFSDIVRDGIALYEAPDHPFANPEPLSPEAARAEAHGYYEKWMPSAEAFAASSQFLLERGNLNEAVFNLHQATERLYHCLLLVLTLYSPKSHRLNFLRSQAEQVDKRLIEAWPRDGKFARRCFDLLRRAYVEARYSKHYKITEEELDWLSDQVDLLQRLMKTVCDERLQAGN